jgi:hypothetical protein
MFSTNTNFQGLTSFTSLFNSYLHKCAHSISIDAHKRIFWQDSIQNIARQEFSRIVS